MRINFLQPGYGRFPVGGFRIVYQYADALAGRGHEVRIIHPATLRRGIRQFPGYFRTLHQIRKGSLWYEFHNSVQMLYVQNLNEKNIPDADVTIATAIETSYYLAEYGKDKGRKYYLIQGYELWAGSLSYLENSWKLPLHKFVISDYLLKIGYDMGLDDTCMTYLPNPLDLGKYRVTCNLNNRRYEAVMLYSTAEGKGSVHGIEALEIIHAKNPDYRAALFGIFPRPKNLPEWIDYYQNPEQNYLINEIYNQARIYMCTSYHEGWGLPGIEAMACGAAVVTTDCGGVRNYAIDGVTACLVPVIKEDLAVLLAEKLELLKNDTVLRDRLISAGLEKVKEFSLEKSLDVLECTLSEYSE